MDYSIFFELVIFSLLGFCCGIIAEKFHRKANGYGNTLIISADNQEDADEILGYLENLMNEMQEYVDEDTDVD